MKELPIRASRHAVPAMARQTYDTAFNAVWFILIGRRLEHA